MSVVGLLMVAGNGSCVYPVAQWSIKGRARGVGEGVLRLQEDPDRLGPPDCSRSDGSRHQQADPDPDHQSCPAAAEPSGGSEAEYEEKWSEHEAMLRTFLVLDPMLPRPLEVSSVVVSKCSAGFLVSVDAGRPSPSDNCRRAADTCTKRDLDTPPLSCIVPGT